MYPVTYLLFSGVDVPVQNGKDIILPHVSLLCVLFNYLYCRLYQGAVDDFVGLSSPVTEFAIIEVAVPEHGYIPEVDSCCVV